MQNRFVEHVRLHQEPRLASPHVLGKVELADPARDLANFPPVQARLHQFRPVLLLVLPEPHVGLERLDETVVVGATSSIRRKVPDASELPIRALHQSAESH
uniref:Uncharacterized protein n=1 Tax=Rhizophora mucronata TaxID=61149 RepID=A0A2P2QQY9_RHIMU